MSTSVTSVTSHFPNPQDGFTTTTSGSISSGATTVPLNSTGSYTNGDVVVLIIEPGTSGKEQTFTGTIDTSGLQVTNVVWTRGTNVAHSAGVTVVDYVSATHLRMMTKGLLVEHAQAGTHTTALVTSRTEDTGPDSQSDYVLTYDTSADALKKVKPVNLGLAGGWATFPTTLTFSSWDSTNVTGVMTTGANTTTYVSVGMRFKITQSTGGTKYFIVTAVAATTVTGYFGTDYTLNNEAISSPYFSDQKAPFGFPVDPAKWTVTTTNTASTSTTTTAGTFVNPGTLSISVPIGTWDLSFEAAMFQSNSSAGIYAPYGGLSTANNSASDNQLIVDAISRTSGTAATIWPVKRNKTITVASATTYYLVITCQVGGGTLTVGWEGTRQTTVIKATCAYL